MTRCSNNYGPYQFPEKVIPLFVTNLIDGKHVPLYGDGLNVRDWLHVDDHCRGIQLVLEQGAPGEIYNIGGGRELTNKELTDLLLQATGRGWDVRRLRHRPARARPALLGRPLASWPRSATRRGTRSRTGWPRPCGGTGTTGPGGSRSRRAAR